MLYVVILSQIHQWSSIKSIVYQTWIIMLWFQTQHCMIFCSSDVKESNNSAYLILMNEHDQNEGSWLFMNDHDQNEGLWLFMNEHDQNEGSWMFMTEGWWIKNQTCVRYQCEEHPYTAFEVIQIFLKVWTHWQCDRGPVWKVTSHRKVNIKIIWDIDIENIPVKFWKDPINSWRVIIIKC